MDIQDKSLSIPDDHLVFETPHWKIFLSPVQSYLGRCEIVAKYHYADLPQINEDVWLDFHRVVRIMEAVLKAAFNATMFNWTCLMNNSYQKPPYHPHVHWHLIPRYNHEVRLNHYTFKDLEFGHHYNPELIEDDDSRIGEIPPELKQIVLAKIKEKLSGILPFFPEK